MHVANLGNYDIGTALSARSRELAEQHGLAEPQTAWLATAFVAMFTGEHRVALDAGARSLAAAEARGDENIAITAMCVQSTPLAGLGDFDGAVEVVAQAVRRAEQHGQPTLLGASLVTEASLHFMDPRGPDFAACLETLSTYPIAGGGASNDMWVAITRATAEVGVRRPGAVETVVDAIRASDRLHALHALDLGVRLLAFEAAAAGLEPAARDLVGYSEAHLRVHRMENPQQAWVQERLEEVLGDLPRASSGPVRTRSEIMRLVTEIEAALTHEPEGKRHA
jgi:hypothetical protein